MNGSLASAGAGKTKKTLAAKIIHNLKYYNFLYVILFGAIAYFLIFKIIPIFNSIYYSLVEYNIYGNHKFVGFQNFRNVFIMKDFWRAFRNTAIIAFNYLAFVLPFPIIISLLLNELLSRTYKKVVQTVIVIPYFISWVVAAGLFALMLSPSTGPVNELIKGLGYKPVFFFGNADVFRILLVISAVWKGCGYSTIIYMAAISSVPAEMYESAVVDGASRFRQIWHITLPSIKDTIFTVYMLSLAAGFLGSEQVFVMYNTAVYETADILSTLSFRMGLQDFRFGNSVVISLCSSIIAFVLFQFSNFLSKKLVGQRLL